MPAALKRNASDGLVDAYKGHTTRIALPNSAPHTQFTKPKMGATPDSRRIAIFEEPAAKAQLTLANAMH
jgi:hypothetical protein